MKRIFVLSTFLIMLLTACGPSSRITSSWKAADLTSKKYKKIVVLGMISDAYRSVREIMEQHIVNDLKALGYDAVCSCEEYNPKAFEGLNEQQAVEKLRNSGVDAVLTVVMLDKTREKYYVPGRIYYSPYSVHQRRFYGYYRTMYDRVYSPGYYVINTKYFWESNFYDLESDQLLYSAQSQSFEAASTQTLAHEYGQLIVKDMVKNKILFDQRAPVLKPM